MKKELYIGLDVHKDSIIVAVAQGGRNGEVRLYGTISNDLHAIEKLLTRRVFALGTYTARAITTGRTFKARFAHVWTMREGRIVRLQQVADTAQIAQALESK